ncbi:MAG: hypothetical protein VZS44_07035 [Bacilli bacterium]|nr:hypothetical protein [Bacilli bacterium]
MNKDTKKILYDAFEREIGIPYIEYIKPDWDEPPKKINKETKKISYKSFEKEIGIPYIEFIKLDREKKQEIINNLKKKNKSNDDVNIDNENIMINRAEENNKVGTKSVALTKKISKRIINR